MRKKHLMIIGAGLLQVPVIEAAAEMGLATIVTDYDKNAMGLKLADYPIIMSTRDVDGTVRVARSFHQTIPIDGVITAGTDASMTVSAVANALGLPGIKYENAEAASNKIKMRKRLREYEVPIPRFQECWTLDDAIAAFEKLGPPLVIKPADNMGARGVRKITHRSEIKEAFELAKSASPTGAILMEEYMEGPELSIDALIYEGEIHITGVADRIIEHPPYFIETGHIMPTNLNGNRLSNALEVFKMGINALGINIGAAKGDIKICKDGAKIGEIAARLSGGFMSAYTYPYSTGINLLQNAIEIALGQPPSSLTPVFNKVSVEKAIIVQPGIVDEISGVDKALSIPGVQEVFIHVKPGDVVSMPKSNVEKSGNIIVVGDTRDEALAIADQALSCIRIITKERPALSMAIIRKNAASKFNKTCHACAVCDGVKCRGEIPGMGGVGTGTSFINNLKALEKIEILPRYLHNGSQTKMNTTLFGYPLDFPVIVSPITGTKVNMGGGMSELDYAMAVVEGALLAGTIAMVGDGANPDDYKIGLTALKKFNGKGIPIFKPRANDQEILKRIKAAEESDVLAVGVDIDAGMFVTMSVKNQSVEPKSPQKIKALIQSTNLPFILKGIMSVEDAIIARDCGAKAIMVSNHGGRVMDYMPGAMDVLPGIINAVGKDMIIMVDGGFRTGIDVFKALSVGAQFVGIGRPISIGAYGAGEEGVQFILENMKKELLPPLVLNGIGSLEKAIGNQDLIKLPS